MHNDRVIQTKLSNGLTLLVCPKKDAAGVSIQLWYNVGSKHEKDGERGIAHFIEHMIFKGTEKLKESDVDLVIGKLSGDCNAFTSYDYTGYLFNIPVANWDKVLPVMADCMQNCSFKQEHLNSELKAVIQELKMYKDDYASTLHETMVTNLFESHPYHFPIIGYKQDLWSVSRETLIEFYKKFYTPDNAALVIVGDVDPEEVHQKVEKEFSHIPAGAGWNNEKFYINEDIKTKSIKLYRDLKQSIGLVCYLMPGIVNQNEFELESFAYVLANGRGSRLYKLLVDELQLVVNIKAFAYDLFDKAIFFVEFTPKKESDIELIIQCIQREIDLIAQHGPNLQEVQRAQRFAQIDYQQMLQDTERQAYAIGKSFVATKDPLYPFTYGNVSTEELTKKIKDLALLCNEVARHQGDVRAIPESQIPALDRLQEASDEEDSLFLDAKQRETVVEEGEYVHSVHLNEKIPSHFSKPNNVKLSNGIDLLWLHHDLVDIVECQLDWKANHFYDEEQQLGLGYVVSRMLLEGTKNYPGQKFSDEAESYGIFFTVSPGHVSFTFLKQDLEKGLLLLNEMLVNPLFQEEALAKVKEQVSLQLKKFWDTPSSFSLQLARDIVYQQHPYHKMLLGSQESIATITLQDCIDYYKKMITPQGARLAIVGNIENQDIQAIVEKTVGQWQGNTIETLMYPTLHPVKKQDVASYINRDQIVLTFAGLSVGRQDEDYDKILLYDQIFAGSVLSSMSTRLFKLRQQSGLFYTIGGSLLYGASEQPGMILIKTIVSNDRVDEAEKAIIQEIDEAINTVTEEELQGAKRVLINSFDTLYESNEQK
ncbi:MAG: insulinase family protein, partial [Candidatus Dependentiae bacterium]|nr:insulinase family protein [Candidatus Dependentiae bacterium]